MSNLIASLKIVSAATAGTAVVGGSVGAIVFYKQNNQTHFSLTDGKNKTNLTPGTTKQAPNPTIYVVAETIQDANAETTEIITNSTTRNYECKFGSSPETKDDACEIEAITLPADKKILIIDQITELTGTTVNNAALKVNGSYFKIKVSDTLYQKIIEDTSDNKIQVVLTNSTNGKKLAELKPIFSFKDSNINAKTLYSIGKVSSFLKTNSTYTDKDEITITNNNSSSQCIFTKNASNQDEETGCVVYKVTNNNADDHSNFSTLSFIGSETEQNDIKKDKYYLFKFDSGSKKEADKFKITASANVKVTNADVDTLNISELIPTIMLESASSNKTLLLLGNINI